MQVGVIAGVAYLHKYFSGMQDRRNSMVINQRVLLSSPLQKKHLLPCPQRFGDRGLNPLFYFMSNIRRWVREETAMKICRLLFQLLELEIGGG
jgi:hypothetical protein